MELRISSNAETLEFQHRQGLVTQTGSIELSLNGGPAIREVVAITGRVRSCYVGVKLAGMSPYLHAIFRSAGAHDAFDYFAQTSDAVRSFERGALIYG